MKKSFIAATVGVLAGATLLMSTAPAMAGERVGVALSVGVPVYAPAPYIAPPVVYGAYGYGYGPVVRVGVPFGPYYYGHGGYYHGGYGYRGYQGHRGGRR